MHRCEFEYICERHLGLSPVVLLLLLMMMMMMMMMTFEVGIGDAGVGERCRAASVLPRAALPRVHGGGLRHRQLPGLDVAG